MAPQPWKSPLITQIVVKSGTVLAAEKAIFRMPVHMRPREKMSTGEPRRSDKTPLRNLEFLQESIENAPFSGVSKP